MLLTTVLPKTCCDFPADNASVQMEELDERVVNMYKQIRGILSKYRSGKLPKAFKIIPSLRNWEQVSTMKLTG